MRTVARIRRATPDDEDRVAQLGRKVAEQPLFTPYGITGDGLAAALSRLARSQREHGERESLLLAEADHGEDALLCGFARFQEHGSLGMGGYLKLIALAPGWEGQGIGSSLLASVEQGVGLRSAVLFLLTAEWNHEARRFYERHGYERAGSLPELVRPGVVELLYWKRLHLLTRDGS